MSVARGEVHEKAMMTTDKHLRLKMFLHSVIDHQRETRPCKRRLMGLLISIGFRLSQRPHLCISTPPHCGENLWETPKMPTEAILPPKKNIFFRGLNLSKVVDLAGHVEIYHQSLIFVGLE